MAFVAVGLQIGLMGSARIPSQAKIDSLTCHTTLKEQKMGPITAKLSESRAAGRTDCVWQEDNSPWHASKKVHTSGVQTGQDWPRELDINNISQNRSPRSA